MDSTRWTVANKRIVHHTTIYGTVSIAKWYAGITESSPSNLRFNNVGLNSGTVGQGGVKSRKQTTSATSPWFNVWIQS